jgi:hypothetical protein
MTQTLIIHVIRTNKIPFLQSRASWPLTVTTLSIMIHHGLWNVAAVFATRLFSRPYAPAAVVLADLDADAACLCEPYSSDQSLVAAKEVDLNSTLA